MPKCQRYGCPREAHPEYTISFYKSSEGEVYPDDVRPRPVCRPHYIISRFMEKYLGYFIFLGMGLAWVYLEFFTPNPTGLTGTAFWLVGMILSGIALIVLVSLGILGIEYLFIRRKLSPFASNSEGSP